MFSDETLSRFDPPRPPTPITAMLSFSLRFLPRTIAGKAKAPAAKPIAARANCLPGEPWRNVHGPGISPTAS